MGMTNGLAWLRENKVRAGEEWGMTQRCACLSDSEGGPRMSSKRTWKLFKSNVEPLKVFM